jgi:peptide/nickel transport system substrate-binding protein
LRGRRGPILWLVVGAVVAFAASVARAGGAAAPSSASAVIGTEQDVPGFNTALTCCNGAWSQAEVAPVIRGAFVVDAHLRHRPDLAVRARATRTTLSYTIRRNAYWFWGGRRLPVTYRDFVYTWRMLVDANNSVATRDGYNLITGYRHHGARQVTFTWKQPYGDWQDLFTRVYPSAALAGANFNEAWSSCICGKDGQPVSDGPFVLTGYTRGEGAALTRNPFWYGRRPALKQIDFRVLADGTSDLQAIADRAVDVVSPPFTQDLLRLRANRRLSVSQVAGLTEEHVDIELGSHGNLLLRAPWMRHVLMLGIDRIEIIRAIFGSFAVPIRPLDGLLYAQRDPHYRADFARWRYDPHKALRLLARHCVGGPTSVSSANAAFWSCSGYSASFRFTWPSGDPARTLEEELIKTELRAIGINVVDAPQPANVIFSPAGIASGDYDLAGFAWSRTPDPSAVQPAWSCGGAANTTAYCDAAVGHLLDAASVEVDPARRASEYRRADGLLARDLPTIPLYSVPVALVRRRALLGVAASPLPGGFTWNAEGWHWRR